MQTASLFCASFCTMGTTLRPVKNWGFFQRKRDYPSISAANVSRGYKLFLPLNIKGSLSHLLSQPKKSSILPDCRLIDASAIWLIPKSAFKEMRGSLAKMLRCDIKHHRWCLISRHTQERNSPCLHLLQVVREVLRVLGDPQVPEYHLYQLVLEVLSLPIVLIDTTHRFLSATESLRSLMFFLL